MQYKLVAIDLDDTLLDKEQILSNRAVQTINSLQNKGVQFVIATGRMFISALPYARKLGLEGPMITYNGAYVKDIARDKLLHHQPVKVEIAREIIEYGAKNNLHVNLYQDDQLYVAERTEEAAYYERTSGVKANVVDSLSSFINQDVTKLLVVEFDRDKKHHHLKILQDKYDSILNVTESKTAYIEFMDRGVSKGKALKVVADGLEVDRKEVIAIGDSWNDLEMIKWAGLGVVMKDSPSGLKHWADLVALSPEEDGVPLILEDIYGSNS